VESIHVLFIALAALGISAAGIGRADGEPSRFRSPQGRFDVAFETPTLSLSMDPEAPADAGRLRFARYRVTFYPAGRTADVAATDFFDVYGQAAGARPTPLEDLFKQILWSPQEDFAILGPEKWPAGQGTSGRKAVSLNPSTPWQTAPFALNDSSLVWVDALKVAGNLQQHCRWAVLEFDGASGKFSPIAEAA